MFSDYDPMSSHNHLSNDDFEQYHAELQKLQDISDAFEQTHDEGKFLSLYLRANCLANELANCRSDLTACQSKLEVEKKDNAQMDIGRLHIALVFSSLSVALFIACCPFPTRSLLLSAFLLLLLSPLSSCGSHMGLFKFYMSAIRIFTSCSRRKTNRFLL